MSKILQNKEFKLGGIYIGWPKCGSTWLFKLLDAHPDVMVPQQKDTHYFDRFHDRGRHWLASQFGVGQQTTIKRKVCVDIGHDYIFSEKALFRIGREEPDATIFIGLRDPVRWILSEYAYVRETGRVVVGFEQYLNDYEYALKYARYESWLKNLLKYVRQEKIKFLILEDLAAAPHDYVNSITESLGVDSDVRKFFDINEVVNPKLTARHKGLLTIAKTASSFGEKIGLHKTIQVAKRSFLRSLIFKHQKVAPVDEESLNILKQYQDQFSSTIDSVSEIAGRDFRLQWGRDWN